MKTAVPGSPGGPDPGRRAGGDRRRGGRLRPWFLPVAVVVLVLVGLVVPLPAFIEAPGSVTGIPACVAIDGPSNAVNGDYLLTTVGQREATVFGLLLAGVRTDQRVVGRRALLGDQRRDRFVERQRRAFIDATDRAVVVALRAAGLPVDILGSGADVVEVIADTPADGVLRPGDVITAVDDLPVTTDTDLIAAIDGPERIVVRVQRDGAEHTAALTPQLRDIDGERRPVIGVRITTLDPRIQLPFDVDVASGRIGGPSAGLMIGLAILDLVDDTDLARGGRIAGTGTLALDGTVGTIAGIDFKVAAAARDGADVFLAPAAQVSAARSAVPAGSGLTVIGVESFDDARAALARRAADGPVASGVSGPTQPCRFTSDA